MDPALYTFAAHAALDFASPLASGVIDRAIGLVNLRAGDAFVDVGSGKGELCLRLAARSGVRCDAIERSPLMAAESRRRVAAAALRQPGTVTIHELDAAEFLGRVPDAHYAAGACIGSTHALGGPAATLTALARIIRSGGLALVGEGFWQQPPPAPYLAATGIDAAEFTPLAGLADAAGAAGLRPHDITTATEREWDEYEWAHARGIESWAAANPAHPDAPAMLARSRAWRDAYLRWGRGTLGFALLLCRVERSA